MVAPALTNADLCGSLFGIVVALALLDGAAAQNFFRSGHPKLAQTRYDPIVSPGKIASHVHKFAGANTLDSAVTYESLRAATATTAEVTDDKSLYWQPSLYWKDGNEKLHLVSPEVGLTVYWFGRKNDEEVFHDIPGGLRMTAGTPYRSDYDPNNLEHQNIGFSCYCMNYPDVPPTNCKVPEGSPAQFKSFEEVKSFNCDVVRLESLFPSCWDGVNLDSDDHRSHMAYPPNYGACPDSHPYRIPTPFIESWYFTNTKEINWPAEGELVLSTGDTTGYGIHGDFFNGFSEGQPGNNQSSPLVRAMNNCPTMNGDAKLCPELQVVAPQGVTPVNALVDEDIGLTGTLLDKLPGDNPYWSSASPRSDDGSSSGSVPVSAPASISAAASSASPVRSSTQIAASNTAIAPSVVSSPATGFSTGTALAGTPNDSPTPVSPTSTKARTRTRGGGRNRTKTSVAVNNANAALPTEGVIGNNLVNNNGTATGAETSQPVKMCKKKKRAHRRRTMRHFS